VFVRTVHHFPTNARGPPTLATNVVSAPAIPTAGPGVSLTSTTMLALFAGSGRPTELKPRINGAESLKHVVARDDLISDITN
jgi:hypothetical protein